MNIVILGNGPSRRLFDLEKHKGDLRVGCNFSHPDHEVHYSVFVDAFAAKLMRKDACHENRLGKSKLILGERCVQGLTNFKATPGSVDSLFKYFLDSGHIEDIVLYPERFREKQEFFSAGHMAFHWATNRFPGSRYHFYGFDSIFTNDHRSSYSNVLRDWPIERPKNSWDTIKEEPEVCWLAWWKDLFSTENYESVTIYGFNSKDNKFHDFGPRVKQEVV